MPNRTLICTALSGEAKKAIAVALWDTPGSEVEPDLKFYFKYYIKQCELIALHDGGCHTPLSTHEDIMAIVQLLRRSRTREEIRRQLLLSCSLPGSEACCDHSIDLAARLLLMVEFGNLPYAYSGFRPIEWATGSLKDFITERFESKPVLGHSKVKLDKIFNANNLGKIAGIEVVWTTNLADHLRLLKDDQAVAVFHHASFLKRQQMLVTATPGREICDFDAGYSDTTLFSQEFIDETLNTMALLFPRWDMETRAWYQTQASLRGLDTQLTEIGQLDADKRQIEKFSFWHDRLVILKQVFDESRPSSLRQWWHDRRNGVQWYTFWVAILVFLLTVFFGLVQSVEGALQVYKAFNPQ
ncbi:hypothetical protein F53441_1885 [Fusarium austroafricanum]|uniref:Uncharacterized protein n=1 Tax=Fusarium austroafricanum TaxID=2364996 RepID=A0A8H4P3H7_9HYPO|nr:hypothetical protein F53441_1885 [Fusarium austroafricanum]